MSKYKVHPNGCKCRVCKNNNKTVCKEQKIVSSLIIGLIIVLIIIISIL
jgi:hypothetical protein